MALNKMMPPGTTVWWVPYESAATKAELLKATVYAKGSGAAVNLSCAIASGMTLNATDSETDSSTTICDSAASETPVRDQYEASITFFRERITEDGAYVDSDSPGAKAWELFKKGGASAPKTGWLVKRIGYANDFEAKEGQEISAYLVMPDNPQDEIGEGTTPIQFTVPFKPQGTMYLNEKLTA